MSTEQSFSQADFRSKTQDYKRDHAHKHKWTLGASNTGRPQKHVPDTKRRTERIAAASLAHAVKSNRKQDMLEGAAITDDSSASNSDEHSDESCSPPTDAGIAYSFDAARGPGEGSQILNTALAKAMDKFEERETVKLVKKEYELLDSDGEPIVASAAKRRKAKPKPSSFIAADDEDYEFV